MTDDVLKPLGDSFCLSDCIIEGDVPNAIPSEDVKEFIKRLKELLDVP